MHIKFNNCETIYNIDRITSYNDEVIVIKGKDIPFNDSGFIFYGDDGEKIDWSNFVYKFNINTDIEDILILSSSEKIVESEDYPISKFYIIPNDDQLNNVLIARKNGLVVNTKELLRKYLSSNPIKSFAHGGIEGTYSVTEEKQQLMTSQYMTYQIKKQTGLDAKLTWNETGKECEEWTEAEFLQLVVEIEAYIHPLVSYQQLLETQIMNCTTQGELDNIVIDYSSVVSK